MNYCPHCNTNYVYSAATHVCTTNTSAQLAGLRAAIAAKDAELRAAKTRIEALETEMIGLQELNVKSVNGAPQAEFRIEGPVMKRVIEALCLHFAQSGAENFVETSFDVVPAVTASPGVQKVGPFTMTIQRKNGITPAQKCGILDAEIAALRAELAEARKVIEELVTLAEIKRDHVGNTGWSSEVVRDDYKRRTPAAWEQARAFLARKETK